jgi:hypothetical protein
MDARLRRSFCSSAAIWMLLAGLLSGCERSCETCHGPTSLHAIEYQYDMHWGTAGYGHIGAFEDCWGCHGFFGLHSEVSPGPAVPTAESVQPASVDSGVATELVIAGQSLTDSVTSSGGAVRTFTPVVVLSLLDGAGTEVASQAIVPTCFTESEIRVTIPATLRTGHWDVRVYMDYQGALQNQSNKLSLATRPRVFLSSAELCVSNHTLTVTGIGFGPQPTLGATSDGLFVGGERCAVSSWSDTSIVGTCSTAAPAAQATVIGLLNGSSPLATEITGGSLQLMDHSAIPRWAPRARATVSPFRFARSKEVCL